MLVELLQPGEETWLLEARSRPKHVIAGWQFAKRNVVITPDLTVETLTFAAKLLADDLNADPPGERIQP